MQGSLLKGVIKRVKGKRTNKQPQTQDLSTLVEDEGTNRFVQYKEFSNDPLKIMRVISINEIPALNHPTDVVVKVKVSRTNHHLKKVDVKDY